MNMGKLFAIFLIVPVLSITAAAESLADRAVTLPAGWEIVTITDTLPKPYSVDRGADGYIYVGNSSESSGTAITRVQEDGTFSTFGAAVVNDPDNVAVHPLTGWIYVGGGYGSSTLYKIDPADGSTVVVSNHTLNGHKNITGLAFATDGTLYVAGVSDPPGSGRRSAVLQISTLGVETMITSAPADVRCIRDIILRERAGEEDDILATDVDTGRLFRIALDGTVEVFGNPDDFLVPVAIEHGRNGNYFVSDGSAQKIFEMDNDGNIVSEFADGIVANGLLYQNGNLYITRYGSPTGTLKRAYQEVDLVINEVMYDPAGDEPSGEWVEIYVALGGADLDGYQVIDQDGYSITFPSFTPQTGDYIVVHTGGDPLSNDLAGPVHHIYRGYGISMWNNDGDDVTIQSGAGECFDYMAYSTGSSIQGPPAGCVWGAGTNPTSGSEGTSVALEENGQDGDRPSDWTESGLDGTMGPHSEGMHNNACQGLSGSESCYECTVSLPAGFPDYLTPPTDLYRDYITIRNRSGSSQTLPIQAQLVSLTAGASAAVPPAVGTGLPGGTHWEFSDADYYSPGVSGTTFPAGAKISERWDFNPDGSDFDFWVDLYHGGKGERLLGRIQMRAGPMARPPAPKGSGEGGVLDDGTAELHTGSADGTCVLANRFSLPSAAWLEEVSFYTSGSAAGELAEVIVYEDLSGEAAVPDSVMEVWRTTVLLGAGGFQSVPAGGCPTLNPDGIAGAAFFAAVADRAEGSYSVGIDLDGPYAGASYVSTDGGLTFGPTSRLPILDGNAMIRVTIQEAGACFIGGAIED